MNELYRQGQVGQQITLPNASLQAERATGFEVGALVGLERFGSVRGSYFWTEVNRPVVDGDAEFDSDFDSVDAGEPGAVEE